ncbi:MTRF1L release factor glutamine methyltransferase-like [Haliotis rufescens]|uniref:MTRF1L release factor glutamine methyltransferase-like n=1 Tax=Haliotis rufescens TaxID=6454 RepID=UPI00201F7E10|nr:MTRF1L release factor glutamine methyltransferase-like [Haliotis rufescens]
MISQACARACKTYKLTSQLHTVLLSPFVSRCRQHLQHSVSLCAKSCAEICHDSKRWNTTWHNAMHRVLPSANICKHHQSNMYARSHTACKHHQLNSLSRSLAARTVHLSSKHSLTGNMMFTKYLNSRLDMCMERLLSTRADGHERHVGDVLEEMQQLLVELGVPEPRTSVELFIAHVLGKSTLHGVSADRGLTGPEVERVWEMVKLRQQRTPVQYILGEWDFCDIVLRMRPPVFIPRPETEELVGFIKSHLQGWGHKQTRLLEIGCGSGAITLALLKEFPQMQAVAVDKTTHACELTADNATSLGLTDRLDVIHLDISAEPAPDLGVFDVIVSNPPYISTEDLDQLDPQVSRYEDRTALHGGGDGLDVVRQILTKAPSLLTHEGTVWLEVDTSHPGRIQSLVEEQGGLRYLRTLQDFTARDRFCVLQYWDPTR